MTCCHKRRLIPQLVRNVEKNDDRGCEVRKEERFSDVPWAQLSITDWPDGRPELRHQHEDVQNEAEPRAIDAALGAESQLVK